MTKKLDLTVFPSSFNNESNPCKKISTRGKKSLFLYCLSFFLFFHFDLSRIEPLQTTPTSFVSKPSLHVFFLLKKGRDRERNMKTSLRKRKKGLNSKALLTFGVKGEPEHTSGSDGRAEERSSRHNTKSLKRERRNKKWKEKDKCLQ